MENETYLFIGGERDGKRIKIGFPAPAVVRCPLRPKCSVGPPLLESPMSKMPVRQSEAYNLCQLRGENRAFYVYVIDGQNGDDLMRSLIDGYKPDDMRREALAKAEKALAFLKPVRDQILSRNDLTEAFDEARFAINRTLVREQNLIL